MGALSAKAINYVLNNEVAPGANPYSDRSIDRGGPTMWGITIKTASAFFGRPFTPDDMKKLTRDDAVAIILKNYWLPLKLNALNDDDIATAILDVDVNRGQGTVLREVKQTLRNLGFPIPDSDPWTNACGILNSLTAAQFIPAFQKVIKDNYELIATNDPTQNGNLHGWLNRADKLSTLVVA